MLFDLETIRQRITQPTRRTKTAQPNERRAAVAAILRPAREPANDTEVLLIRRAERPGDPWSGHMAFPGGHHEPEDPDLRATAMRETLEEVGIDLRLHDYLGPLDEISAMARGRPVGMTIAPHVFALRESPLAVLRPNVEVAELVWGRLGPMIRGEIDAIKEMNYGGEVRQLPAFRVHDHLVWGMTHNMLRSLFEVLKDTL